MDEYYKILELSPGASQEDIKKQYKKKCFETHPDRNNGKNEEFLKVQEAYEVLAGKRNSGAQHEQDFPFGFDDGFDLSQMQDVFNRIHSQRRRVTRPPQDDSQIEIDLNINLRDARRGRLFETIAQKSRNCNSCNGIGGKTQTTCEHCHGQGRIKLEQRNGNSIFTQIIGCNNCNGEGKIIKDKCKDCNGLGFVVYEERVVLEIKEKK